MDQIIHAIRPLCSTEEGLQEAAMNIYLTAMGVRPASLPFDVDSHDEAIDIYLGNKQLQKDIAAIPNIVVKIGPYFDSGDVILIVNKNRMKEVEPLLRELEEIAHHAETTGTSRSENPKLHILIGKILGYVCPADMASLWNEEEVDDISFVIDGIAYMGVWCPKNKNTHKKAEDILKNINEALRPLGKSASLDIRVKKMKGGYARRHTVRRRRNVRSRRRTIFKKRDGRKATKRASV